MGMLEGQVQFVIGVDTHRDTHTAAITDAAGAVLMDATVATTTAGHRQLLGWPSGTRRDTGCGRWRAPAASGPG